MIIELFYVIAVFLQTYIIVNRAVLSHLLQMLLIFVSEIVLCRYRVLCHHWDVDCFLDTWIPVGRILTQNSHIHMLHLKTPSCMSSFYITQSPWIASVC